MKSLSKLILVFTLILWGLNTAIAQQSLRGDKAKKAAEVKNLISNKDFVFEATKEGMHKGGVPLKYHKYDVAIAKDTLVANLPGAGNGPLKVSSRDYTYNEMKRKNGYDIIIKPKSGITSDVKQIKMEVTPQGHASVRVMTTNRRGPLEFDGYVKQEDY
ncbi:MAG TPA: DUF4251 domain-containing protein [Mucilaginibacter sp.]|jgi:ribosomal protein S28E/S33